MENNIFSIVQFSPLFLIASIALIADNRDQTVAWWQQFTIDDSFLVPSDTQHHLLWHQSDFALLSHVIHFSSPLSIFPEKAQFCFVSATIRK